MRLKKRTSRARRLFFLIPHMMAQLEAGMHEPGVESRKSDFGSGVVFEN